MATSLCSLPDELLADIFQYCAQPNSPSENRHDTDTVLRRDLCSLSLCSTQMRAVAESILYKSFFGADQWQLLNFLRSILNRPELAQYVTHLKVVLDFSTQTRLHYTGMFCDPSSSLSTKLCNAIASFDDQNPEKAHWFEAIRSGCADGAAAIALTLLPQLQQLSIDLNSDGRNVLQPSKYRYISKVFRDVISKQNLPQAVPNLQLLRTLEIMPLREWDRILASSPSMPMVLQFCKLASIKKLVLTEYHLDRIESELRLPTMDLELRLYDTDDLRSLSQFITCFPALERFTFGRQYRSWNRSGSSGDGDNLNEIVQCLFRVRTSLKYLCLESAGDCRRGCDEIQSLVEFSSLEVIDVVAFDLWLYTYDNGPDLGDDDKPLDPRVVPMVDLLPPHIRHLSLRLGSRMTVVHALGLLEAKKEQKQVSCLETLHITLTEYSHRPSKSEIDELLETGIKCGVKVIVERESLSGCLWKWKI